ncbi:MAG TPA: CocE/NonD family hydrolase C-terminal non-catalytic domain-containing protein [Actinomycetota bacterium]|nr:CocE/NonD family hydrolase C-terminal non-catalytic domain-containing protein [Actinomycetota bacterium]
MRTTTPRSALGLLLLAVAVAATTLVPAAAQAPEPKLVDESLQALEGLVGKAGEHCSLKDAGDDETSTDTKLPYVYCDDGLPPRGGGANGIPVPVAYHSGKSGDDFSRLPRVATAEEIAEKNARFDLRPDAAGDRVTLDVNVTLPPSPGIAAEHGQPWRSMRVPRGGYPVIVLMHGCCGGNKNSWEAGTVDAAGEKWHQSNAWFASRGYVVVTYTARGFRNMNDQGSTGTTQLDSRRFEINDYQYLVGLLVDHDAQRRAAGKRPIFNVNPSKIGAVGGSYGGGFSWLAVTDPRWASPATRTRIRLRAAAPRYGWADLLESLVPNGHYKERDHDTGKTVVPTTKVAGARSRHPLGVEKQSIVSLLYGTGNAAATNHTTFPDYLHEAYQRLQAGEPYDGDPVLEQVAQWFLEDRSAYYQQRFWRQVARGLRVPAFVAATWTDPLFTARESGLLMYNKLKRMVPKYPIQMYLGDYQHFTANKAKEWNDLCGDDHHVCTLDDYKTADGTYDFDRAATRVRQGVTFRMNRFLDFYLQAEGNKPRRKVWATTTICRANATEAVPADEPGIEYAAGSWRALARDSRRFAWSGGGVATTTTSSTATDNHASESDPAYRVAQPDKCYTTQNAQASPGVVQYQQPVGESFTMMGLPSLKLTYSASAPAGDYWIAARLFDKAPDGSITLVTRGICRVNENSDPDAGCEIFELWGNGWTFEKDHSVLLEITQADTPMFRRNNFPSTVAFKAAEMNLPVTNESLRRDFRDSP